jgi:Pentapeptide repeats (8 copies)
MFKFGRILEEMQVDQQEQSRWRAITRGPLVYVWICGGSVLVLVLILVGYHYKITLWDWAKLLFVPAVLALGGYLFTRSENHRTQKLADQRAQDDRDIANNRRQDEALQAYLDQMSQLLTDKERPLRRTQQGDNLSVVARARTLTVLQKLGPDHKRSTLHFLYESGLITRELVVSLVDADLSGAELSGADLSEAYLGEADLSEAYLSGTNLSRANFSRANFSGAYLDGAVGASGEQLEHASLLKGTTMPDGQPLRGDKTPNGPTFEDWLKSKDRAGDGETPNRS